MTADQPTGKAFRQFQYPTLPLHPSQRRMRDAVDAVQAASVRRRAQQRKGAD